MEKVCEDTEQKKWQPQKDGFVYDRLSILSVKKEAKLSAREVDDVKEGKGSYLRRSSLFTVCQRRRGFSEEEETRLEK